MEGMRGSSYTLCETFCILEFSRKLAVKSAYPRVLSAKNLTGGKLRPDRHAVDPYAPLPLPLSLRFPLSFEESSRSYLNSPSTTLSRLPGYPFCAFLPPSYLLWISPSLSLDRRGEVYRRLKPRSSLPTATTANRAAAISTLSTIKQLPPRCLSRYFPRVYLCHRLDPPNRPFNLTLRRKPYNYTQLLSHLRRGSSNFRFDN